MSWKRPLARVAEYTGAGPTQRPIPLRIEDTRARCVVPIPKRAHLRIPALLRACRELPCQHCGTSDGTVVAAHSNQAIHGKGRSLKASDQFVAALCHACHHELDQGAFLNQAGRVAMWNAAHVKTVALLKAAGKWPTKSTEDGERLVPKAGA